MCWRANTQEDNMAKEKDITEKTKDELISELHRYTISFWIVVCLFITGAVIYFYPDEEKRELNITLAGCQRQLEESAVDYFGIDGKNFLLVRKNFLLKQHENEKLIGIKYMSLATDKETLVAGIEGGNHFIFPLPEAKVSLERANIRVVTAYNEFYLKTP